MPLWPYAVVAAACPTRTAASSAAAGNARRRWRSAHQAAAASASPPQKSTYPQVVTSVLPLAHRAAAASRPAPAASARGPGSPADSPAQAAITAIPASTKVCRYGLPFGVANRCQARWVGAHWRESTTAAVSPAHASRVRTGTARWKGSAATSSSVPVPTKTAGEEKEYVAGNSRAKRSAQDTGRNSLTQPGYACPELRKRGARTGAASAIPSTVVPAARPITASPARAPSRASTTRTSSTSAAPRVAM